MKGCYGKGGKIRPKTVHGLRTGQHNNPNVLRAARDEVKQVDGKRPKMRMDRPARADGGPVTPGQQMQDARQRRDDSRTEVNKQAGNAAMNAGITAALHGVPGKFGKFLKYGNAALAGSSALEAAHAHGKQKAAEAEMQRLGSPKVTEGEEDRKSGGRIKKKGC